VQKALLFSSLASREDNELDAVHVFQVASLCRKKSTEFNIVSKGATNVID
jgi:hypothetical protein